MNHSRPRRYDDTPQITVEATVKPAANNTEVLVFTIQLGPIDIICIVNIPPEGEHTAPVYVKFKWVGVRRGNTISFDELDTATG